MNFILFVLLAFQQSRPVFVDGLSESSKLDVLSSRLDTLHNKISDLKKNKVCKGFNEYQVVWKLALDDQKEITNFRQDIPLGASKTTVDQAAALEGRVAKYLERLHTFHRRNFPASCTATHHMIFELKTRRLSSLRVFYY
jgi:hypothetical protein